jgi:Uncharacterised nucleotidyltransferase
MSSTGPQREDEFGLLCALASAKMTAGQIERIASWNFSGLDWNEIIRLAEHHGLLPLAARHLIEQGRGLPPEIEHTLRSAYELNLKRGLWFAAELARVIRHLDRWAAEHGQTDRQQFPVLPFKGPMLAQSLYGDPGLRSFSDLDLLISSTDFGQAKQALAEIGYSPAKRLDPAAERFWLQNGYEQSFNGAAGDNLLELQWALLPYFYAVDLNVENLLARSGHAVAGGCHMRCLSAEDSVIVLSLHAAKHLWGRLIWLVDIAETLRSGSIDYGLVFSNARSLGIARILGVTFWLVKNVLHAELPDAAEEMIASDPAASVLGQEFAARLRRAATYDFESTEYFRLILKLRERLGDRWRYLRRLFWTPGESDLAALRLPEALFPLYRIVRVGRLMRKLFS